MFEKTARLLLIITLTYIPGQLFGQSFQKKLDILSEEIQEKLKEKEKNKELNRQFINIITEDILKNIKIEKLKDNDNQKPN